MLVAQRVMIPVGVMIGETKKPSNFWGEMYRGHLMNCEAKLRGRTVGGKLGPARVSNFRPQICFWWIRGAIFRSLEDSGVHLYAMLDIFHLFCQIVCSFLVDQFFWKVSFSVNWWFENASVCTWSSKKWTWLCYTSEMLFQRWGILPIKNLLENNQGALPRVKALSLMAMTWPQATVDGRNAAPPGMYKTL